MRVYPNKDMMHYCPLPLNTRCNGACLNLVVSLELPPPSCPLSPQVCDLIPSSAMSSCPYLQPKKLAILDWDKPTSRAHRNPNPILIRLVSPPSHNEPS